MTEPTYNDFAPPEQAAIRQAADALRWQLNGAQQERAA